MYGNLPRKFNIAVSGSRDDFAHTHINDIGLQPCANAETGEMGFNVVCVCGCVGVWVCGCVGGWCARRARTRVCVCVCGETGSNVVGETRTRLHTPSHAFTRLHTPSHALTTPATPAPCSHHTLTAPPLNPTPPQVLGGYMSTKRVAESVDMNMWIPATVDAAICLSEVS